MARNVESVNGALMANFHTFYIAPALGMVQYN